MNVLIHACPQRMWYVDDFLVPSLQEQGLSSDDIEVWNDTERKGNLIACMESFAAREGSGGTWHLQDDVLVCSDFVKRCTELDHGAVYGFACAQFGDDLQQTGTVYAPDAWHSFQCVRIPDSWARDCAEWFFSGEWRKSPLPELFALHDMGQGDDSFFREFLQARHGTETVINAKPNLVEHVDWIIGGSILSKWREYIASAYYWDDLDRTEDLLHRIRDYKNRMN